MTETDETMNETGAFNSLRNVVIVNTADSLECRLTEIFGCFKHCFAGAEVANFKNDIDSQ